MAWDLACMDSLIETENGSPSGRGATMPDAAAAARRQA
jgi:hypothetical protein